MVEFPLKPQLKDEDGDGSPDYAELTQEVADEIYEYVKSKAQEEAKQNKQTQGGDLLGSVTRIVEKILPLKITLGLIGDLFAAPTDALTGLVTGIFNMVPIIFVVVTIIKALEGLT